MSKINIFHLNFRRPTNNLKTSDFDEQKAKRASTAKTVRRYSYYFIDVFFW